MWPKYARLKIKNFSGESGMNFATKISVLVEETLNIAL
jgi:hypothetical protein